MITAQARVEYRQVYRLSLHEKASGTLRIPVTAWPREEWPISSRPLAALRDRFTQGRR